MAVRTYNSKNVVLSLGGVRIQGFGDADLITMSALEDKVAEYVGSDSEVTIAPVNNPIQRATINLAQSSPSHDYIYSLDNPGQVFSFALNDLNSGTLVLGNAWVFRAPDTTFSKAVSTWAWQLGVEVTSETLGGISVAIHVA